MSPIADAGQFGLESAGVPSPLEVRNLNGKSMRVALQHTTQSAALTGLATKSSALNPEP